MLPVIIPAHNEAPVVGRLLQRLLADANPGEFDIIVVANGCADSTAEIAASFGPPVRVISIPFASKREALRAGNQAAGGFPRIYVDADVELGGQDVRALADALQRPGVLGVGPRLNHALAGRPWPIRWYYDIWERLPEVQHGLFGRGVVGVSEAGYRRLAQHPPAIADDLAASLAFGPDERAIVPQARVTVHPPRTLRDLLHVRIRAAMGTAEIESAAGTDAPSARTRPAHLMSMLNENPLLFPKVWIFMSVALVARIRARHAVAKSGYSAWFRDHSSRAVKS